MSDGVNIDFSALKDPDYVGAYVNAFKAGQAMGGQAAGAPGGAGNAMTGEAPAGEDALRARFAAMSPGERAAAARQADLLAGVGGALKSVPYAQRPAVLAHMTPALAARGVPAWAIGAFDPTDANLDAAAASAKAIGAMVGAG